MDRRVVNMLIVNDDDLNCDCKSKTIDDISIINVGFSIGVLDKFEMVVYKGSKGTKVLKSVYTKTGTIK